MKKETITFETFFTRFFNLDRDEEIDLEIMYRSVGLWHTVAGKFEKPTNELTREETRSIILDMAEKIVTLKRTGSLAPTDLRALEMAVFYGMKPAREIEIEHTLSAFPNQSQRAKRLWKRMNETTSEKPVSFIA